MTRRRYILWGAAGIVTLAAFVFHERLVIAANITRARVAKRTVNDRLKEFAADVGIANITVICSPVDFRKQKLTPGANQPPWLPELYRQIAQRLSAL